MSGHVVAVHPHGTGISGVASGPHLKVRADAADPSDPDPVRMEPHRI